MLDFDNSYARLPAQFYARLVPTRVSSPRLIAINQSLAENLRIDPDWLASQDGVDVLSGNRVAEGAEPLAMAYAGHQFGNWVPQLGDGRALLLGEIRGRDGIRYDLQLKGSGPTPFSRNADGRAALGPVLREFIVSEAMHALGVPTTRTLAAVTTGENILRQEGMLPGAVLARVSTSHVRVGTFEFFGNRGDTDSVRVLADYVLARLYADADGSSERYLSLLEAVVERTAKLIARWQLIGFIHGVMNTDNTSIAGETIDYGPCAFMDAYDPATVYSSIDLGGRYAYANQPGIGQWNLVRLALALLPLLSDTETVAVEKAQAALNAYAGHFEAAYSAGLRAKTGLTEQREGDAPLIAELLRHMKDGRADFTLTFRRLCDSVEGRDEGLRALFDNPAALDAWLVRWRARLNLEAVPAGTRAAAMRKVNPEFIPRNHRIEAVIVAAQERGDLSPFEELRKVLSAPYESQPEHARYADPPKPDEMVQQTFCGT